MSRDKVVQKILSLTLLLACGMAHADSIPLIRDHGTLGVPVVINDKITLNFTIDSGASDVSIPADVFSTLTRAGTVSESEYVDKQVYELADGTKHTSQRFRIRSLRIGNTELRDVIASISPQEGSLLLGQSFFSRFQSWSIDNTRLVLVINEAASPISEAVVLQPTKAIPAQTSKWVSTDSDDQGTESFVDRSSVIVTGDTRHAWSKRVYLPHVERGALEDADEWKKEEMVRFGFNCSEQTYRIESLTIHYYGGKTYSDPVSISSFPDPWQPVPPDTLLSVQMNLICSLTPR